MNKEKKTIVKLHFSNVSKRKYFYHSFSILKITELKTKTPPQSIVITGKSHFQYH